MSLIHRGAEMEKGGSAMHPSPAPPPPPPPPSFWSVPPPPPPYPYPQASPSAFFGAPSSSAGATSFPQALGGALGAGAAADGALGTNKNPVIMAFVSSIKTYYSYDLPFIFTFVSWHSPDADNIVVI